MAVLGPSGRKLSSQVIETNGRALIEAIKTIPKPRHLCMEEGCQSSWLYEVLSPHVDELVVTGVTQSRGPKSDARDALGLASGTEARGCADASLQTADADGSRTFSENNSASIPASAANSSS
jgi:hypothetical protein